MCVRCQCCECGDGSESASGLQLGSEYKARVRELCISTSGLSSLLACDHAFGSNKLSYSTLSACSVCTVCSCTSGAEPASQQGLGGQRTDGKMSQEMHCRICLDNKHLEDFISPCKCSGTLKYVHRKCFLLWVRQRSRQDQQFKCEICNTIYLDYPSQSGFLAYIGQCLNFREANRNTVAILVLVIHLYLLYFVIFSGPLEITVHSGQVPDMDILLWEKSDAYAVVCVDKDCRCETEVRNNNDRPRWEHQCEYWRDKSTFVFSRITFLVFDADIDQNDDFIGEVSISIYRVLFNMCNGKATQLRWDIPYKGNLLVTIKWTSNLIWLINHFYN